MSGAIPDPPGTDPTRLPSGALLPVESVWDRERQKAERQFGQGRRDSTLAFCAGLGFFLAMIWALTFDDEESGRVHARVFVAAASVLVWYATLKRGTYMVQKFAPTCRDGVAFLLLLLMSVLMVLVIVIVLWVTSASRPWER